MSKRRITNFGIFIKYLEMLFKNVPNKIAPYFLHVNIVKFKLIMKDMSASKKEWG